MDMHARAFSLILVLGALVGCDDSSRSPLTPLSPSLLTTGEIIAAKTAEMQTRVDDYHASGDIDNAGIARGHLGAARPRTSTPLAGAAP